MEESTARKSRGVAADTVAPHLVRGIMSKLKWNRSQFIPFQPEPIPDHVKQQREAKRPSKPFLRLTGQRIAWKNYLASQNWEDCRKAIMAKRGRICERCHNPALKFWVLILNWKNVGYWQYSDLQVVCEACGLEDKLKRNGIIAAAKPSEPREEVTEDCPF
jgi:hypothetical protein